MRSRLFVNFLAALVALSAVGAAIARTRTLPSPELRFTNAATSADELIAQLVQALAAKDREAMERLRVTESEYRTIIMPWTVEKGAPRQRMPERISHYYWSEFNLKSLYSGLNLMNVFGGHTYTIKDVRYEKGSKEYAWFTAHRQLRLTLEDEGGKEVELRTGSIVELNGRFKFASFIRD